MTMGLFKKKEEKKTEILRLPDLPKLPELPDSREEMKDSDELISQLPSFPSGSLGDKFSRYNIKEAITGEKEEEGDADEFAEEQKMQKPLTKEISSPKNFYSNFEKTKEAEPIFIRIDNFEQGSQTFEEVKKQILEIEKMFSDLKKVKEDEEKELTSFEDELREIKEKIEKINQNIFSKVR
jgi:hypothetical protein